MEVLLETSHLHKTYHKRTILNDIHFEVRSGEFVYISGPNGSGKTTIFQSLLNFIRVDKGQFFWSEEKLDITRYPTADRVYLGIAYMPQLTSLIDGITVSQTLDITKKILKNRLMVIPPEMYQILNDIFNIEKHLNQEVSSLSRGESRKFEFLLTLFYDAKLYIFDEPTAGWDKISQQKAYEVLKWLKNVGKTIILCDHNKIDSSQDIIDTQYEIMDGNMNKIGN